MASGGLRTGTALLLGALACLTGCGDDGDKDNNNPNGPGPDGTATISLQLTDAPGDLAHAWVEISRITLKGESDGDVEQNVTLFEGSTGMIDLLTLADATVDLIEDVAVPAASYNDLRLIITGGVIETEDGRVFAIEGSAHPEGKAVTGQLQCPSCAQSGLKVKLPGLALELENEAKVLVLDFDVSQSFGRQAGRSGRWVMRPVIQATDLQFSGAIEGRVALDDGVVLPVCGGQQATLELFTVRTFDAADAQRSGVTGVDGRYRVDWLVPGRYGMGWDASVEFDEDVLNFTAVRTPTQVVVEAGGTANADFTVTSATCNERP